MYVYIHVYLSHHFHDDVLQSRAFENQSNQLDQILVAQVTVRYTIFKKKLRQLHIHVQLYNMYIHVYTMYVYMYVSERERDHKLTS